MNISENIIELKAKLPKEVTLVAVSKTKPVSEIMEAYNTGQRIFGENKIQEMASKFTEMPKDIEWHMIGHIQSNKVKYMAPFVSLIHAVDSLKLLKEINKQALKNNRIISCLLQLKIASEESKFGMIEQDIIQLLTSEEFLTLQNIKIEGLMGMATFTNDEDQLSQEFQKLNTFYTTHKDHYSLNTLSMGMSGDYPIAISHGSTMVRVGSAIFGERNYSI
ncbi:YggS family pyridoxal phosphate-dependent enzyme [Candidatus Marifrigoribacter sp. Uisw_064]|jgi:pyridoxal phosphate enzyme (YggS family)|uniref:YggS family pyridoxal phosphate-dependent enzyme n=1 Tax=Candidatus Marifrigoribacter sp. Uisw_064 TaxID=3230970 RepID=UPI003D48B4C6